MPHAPADIRLEPFTEAHLGGMEAMLHDPAVLRFTRVPDPVPEGFSRTWLARYEDGRRQGTREAFAILDAKNDRYLGIAVAPRIDAPGRTLELGYAIAPGARGRGVATATLRWLTSWAFETYSARRLELIIGVENEASKAVARHCGYRFEGVLRSLHLKQEIWEDAEIWSRISTDGA